uniref:3-hydroxyisobutyrate dehydrogenase n=1 Tax=Saccoglossus kowalevskii TaxID=10224 RepID=A0ABM0LU36_SACKO
MGGPMAQNLIKHGYALVVYEVYPEAITPIQDLGAQVAESPAEVAQRTDRIITMLPSSTRVQSVYAGSDGILSSIKQGSLLIDNSTIDPTVSKDMAALAEKKGCVFMDAPVSG